VGGAVSARDSDADRFVVAPGTPFSLDDRDAADTKGAPGDKKATQKVLDELGERLMALQDRLYAESGQALLVVLQAMDAGGKDGTVKHVFAGANPQGVRVTSFKQPTPQELAHDFLWRIHAAAPAHGYIGIFNRSHYEDVLVARVHELVDESVWRRRYRHINHFEALLHDAGTRVVKLFLHISREEQAERLRKRLEDPEKRWKFRRGDLAERERWDDYMAAYEEAIARTSTEHAPWYVVPADHKWFRNWAVSRIVIETLEAMDPRYPEPAEDLDGITVT
jgi:PPK2 family polyphosphate:nucleotide phosphotransferase